MTDPTPAHPRTDEPLSAAAAFGPYLPMQLSAPQPASTVKLIPPPDQMALELKAVRQQALSTQAGIKQLQLEQPNQPFANLLSCLPFSLTPGTAWLGIGILILGGILTRSGLHRLQARSIGSKPAFVDSCSPPDDRQDSATMTTRESARVVAAALPEAAPALPSESQWPPDVPRCAAACDLDVNLEDLLLIQAPVIQSAVGSPDTPVAKINHVPGFDREAAADEVERVLKSLASKRAARSRRPQNNDSAVSPEQDAAMMLLPPFGPATDQQRAADQGRTKPEATPPADQHRLTPQDVTSVQLEPPPDAAWLDFDMLDQPVADLRAVLPVVLTTTTVQNADDEPDHQVQLSLAQEFEALGLTLGARELATEVLDSPNSALNSYAQALLRQIEDQDLADPGMQRSIF